MKKLLVLGAVMLGLVFALTGCSKNSYENNISEIRDNIFIGETEHFEVSVFTGKREDPYKADGVANKMIPYFLVIVSPKFDTTEDDTMNANVMIKNKSYVKNLTKDVFRDKFIYDYANLSADENFVINLQIQSYDEDVTMLEMFTAGMKPYSEALTEAMAMLKDKLEATKEGNKYNCEIYVKLSFSTFMSDQRLYWHVSLLDSMGNITGVIIDADT